MVTPLSEGLTRQFRLADGFTPRDADAPVVPAGRLGTWESDRPRQGKLAYPVSHAGQPFPSSRLRRERLRLKNLLHQLAINGDG
jgi:hypothetical protein